MEINQLLIVAQTLDENLSPHVHMNNRDPDSDVVKKIEKKKNLLILGI